MKHRADDGEPEWPEPVVPVSDWAATVFLTAVALAVGALFVGIRVLFI